MHLARHDPNHVFKLQTIYGSLYFRDNFGDITNLANLFYRQVYELRALNVPGVILDVGANIGLAAAWFAHFNPSKEIYCFEPLPGNTELIRLNCPAAHVERVALGASRGQTQLQVDPDGVMASCIPMAWDTNGATFDVMPLDEFIQAAQIDHVALLKIDAEGMEIEILNGCHDTLLKTQLVAMETHGSSRHVESAKLLRSVGFVIDKEEFSGDTGMLFASRGRTGVASDRDLDA